MRFLRCALASFLGAAALASCMTGGHPRLERNREDVESAIALQEKQAAIEDYIRSLPQVLSARVFVGPESVIIEVSPRDKAVIDRATQDRINSYVTAQTGFSRDKIALWVPERAIPGSAGD